MVDINLPANFLIWLKSGSLKIKSGEKESINFLATKNSRVIDIIEIPIKVSKKLGLIKQLSEARKLAKKLKQENITLEIKFKGQPVLKLGDKANPKIAKIITLSNDIEITDIKKLKHLMDIL